MPMKHLKKAGGYLGKVMAYPGKPGRAPLVFKTAEYAGLSALVGALEQKYRVHGKWSFDIGKVQMNYSLAGGLLAKLGQLWGMGRGWGPGMMTQLDVFGNVGVMSYFHTLGSGIGAKWAMGEDAVRLMMPKADYDRIKKTLPPRTEEIAGIPPAPHGDYLSAAELAEMAR